MGKGGGGGGGPQQVTSTTTNLPEYAQPYFENLMQRAQAESYRGYTPYGAERLAGFTPEQIQAQQQTMALQTPGQFGAATGLTGAAGLGSLGAGQQYMGMATDPTQIQAFMSPYQQAVTDVAKRGAIREAQMAQQQVNLGAARQGTYGGARQALAQAERERGLLDRLTALQAEGGQKAFEAARQAQQYGMDLGLRGMGQGIQAGQTLGQLGQSQQQADLQRLTAQEAVGAQQRAFEQQRLDQAYADFLRQRDYPMEQLGYFSNLMRGIPVQLGSTQTTYAQPPSIASQIGGLGLAGLSIGKMAGAFAKGGEVAAYAPGGAVSSPEKLDSITNKLSDQQLQMQLRTAVPGTPEHLMVAGELQARKTLREKANVPQANPTPVIADLLTGGAMPQMPQMQQVAMTPENAGGVAALPAPNMENVEAMAAGGLVAFEDGGPVARYDVGGGVSLTDVLRTLNMDERRMYQQTGRLPPRAQAMLTGQAPMPAAPTPGMGMAGTGPATISMAADPNAPAQVPLPENMRFYPGTAGLIQGPQATRQLPKSIEDRLALAQSGQGPDVSRNTTINPNIPLPGQEPITDATKKEAPADDGGLGAIAKARGMDYATANAQAKEMMGKELADLGDPFKDIRDEMKNASEERKADLKNSAWMRLAEFGFGMTAGTSPNALVNAGKAGVEALKGYADDLREKKKLDRDDRKMLADLKRLENADKRDNIFKTADLSLKILSEANAEQRAELAARTQLAVANIGKTTASLDRAAQRDATRANNALDQARRIVETGLGAALSPEEKEAKINELASSIYQRMKSLESGEAATAAPNLSQQALAELAKRGLK